MPRVESRDSQFAAAIEFGSRVRARRLELGLTQERLAELAGVHFTYVSTVERGRRNIGLRNIMRFSRVLEVEAWTLVKGLPDDAG